MSNNGKKNVLSTRKNVEILVAYFNVIAWHLSARMWGKHHMFLRIAGGVIDMNLAPCEYKNLPLT
jgi:hypothetical protein